MNWLFLKHIKSLNTYNNHKKRQETILSLSIFFKKLLNMIFISNFPTQALKSFTLADIANNNPKYKR
jgi:hypothetical protein